MSAHFITQVLVITRSLNNAPLVFQDPKDITHKGCPSTWNKVLWKEIIPPTFPLKASSCAQ